MSLFSREHDELYLERGIGPDSSPVGASLDKFNTQQRAARFTTYAALDTNPDEYAKARVLAAKTSTTPDAAMDDQYGLARRAAIGEIDFKSLPPTTLKLLSDPSFAMLAHDDIGSILFAENSLREMGNLRQALKASVPRFKADGWGLARIVADKLPFESAKYASSYFGWLANEQILKAEDLMPHSDSRAMRGVYSGVSELPATAATVALAFLNPPAALAAVFGRSAGQAYNEARDNKLKPDAALGYAVKQAGIDAATSILPLNKLLKDIGVGASFVKTLSNQLLTQIPADQLATHLQDLNRWATLNPEKPFSSYLEERPDAAVETLFASLVTAGATTSVVKSTQTVFNRLQKQGEQAQQAEEAAAYLENLSEAAKNSALRDRAPDVFEQFVKEVSEDTPVQHVFIDGQTLAQSKDAPKLAEVSKSIAEQIEEAAANGGDVRIPIEEYASRIAGTDLAAGLLNDLKVDPDGMTFGEAQAFRQSERKAMAEQVAEQVQETEKKQAPIDEFKEIQRTIQSRLDETKTFSKEVSEAYAALPAAFFSTMAQRTGQSALELFKQHEAKISGQSLSDSTVFLQENLGHFAPKRVNDLDKNELVIFRGADLSTFLHESGHWFLEAYADMAQTHDVLKGDMQQVFDWIGVKDMETWKSMTLDEQRDSHEQFARGFEAYLLEGRAANLKLQSIFERFKAWLKRIYTSMRDLDVELTPEVRGVFDRMLATDTQIEQAQRARSMMPLFRTPEEAAEHGVDWASYAQASARATAEASAQLDARLIKDMAWIARLRDKTAERFKKDAKQKRRETMSEAELELAQTRVYKAIDFLKHGTQQEGTASDASSHKLGKNWLEALYPEGLEGALPWKKLGQGKTGMIATEGLHPDVAAESLGYSSGDAMVREILNAPSLKEAAADLAGQKMLERYGDITSEEMLSKATDEAIFNDVSARLIAREFAALKQLKGDERVLMSMARERAREMVGNTTVKDLKPYQYIAASARAGRAAELAFKARDIAEAVNQKRIQLIQHTATKVAFEAQADSKETLGFFNTVVRKKDADLAKMRDMDVVNVARAILGHYGVENKRIDLQERLKTLKEHSPEIHEALEDQITDAARHAKPIKELTINELNALKDTIDSLWSVARRERQIEIDGRKLEKEAASQEIVSELGKHPMPKSRPGATHAPTTGERTLRALQGLNAALRRVESWVDRMDNGDIRGPLRKYIYQPISEASDRLRAVQSEKIKQVHDLLKPIASTFVKAKIDATKELGYTFGHGNGGVAMNELIGALLHTGNLGNKEKNLISRGWGEFRADGSLDTSQWDAFVARMINEGVLKKEHFDFVQGIWDVLESVKPAAQEAHKTIYGRYFDEVSSQEVVTPFGTYRGGYYPAVADPFITPDAAQKQAMNTITEGADYMFPASPSGFTKSRVKNYQKPLAMDVRLIGQHLNKVLLFSHLSVPVRQTLGLLRHPDLKGMLDRMDPTAYSDLLLPWLNRAAKQIVETPSTNTAGRASASFWRAVRRNTGISFMFGNVTNAAQNITGLSTALTKVDNKHMAASLVHATRDYRALRQAISESSAFMANRYENQYFNMNGEIEKILTNPGTYKKSAQYLKKNAYFMQQPVQNVVDTMVWHAAYNQALDKKLENKDAIRSADSAVRLTQVSYNPEDVSRMETGTAFERVFTQFASYYNMQYNLVTTETAKIMSKQDSTLSKAKQITDLYMKAIAVPAILGMLIYTAVKGGFSDREEDQVWNGYLEAFIGANLTPFGPISVFPNTALKSWSDTSPLNDKLITPPAIGAAASTIAAPKSVAAAIKDSRKAGKAIKDTGVAVSVISGVPIKPFTDRVGYAVDVAQGKTEPDNMLDFIRGLVTGRNR